MENPELLGAECKVQVSGDPNGEGGVNKDEGIYS